MTRREFIAASFASAAAAQTGSGPRPNVLLIMTDQQRSDSLGCYGNAAARTPHIDSLAGRGVLFENCWTQHPVCMPSRACAFTGRYPSSNGVWANGVPLPRDETTLAQVFLENGYETFGAGKFHFLPHYQYRLPTMDTHPEPYYGFGEFHIGEDGRRGEHELWIERHHPEFAGKPDHEIPPELHNTHWVASHTIDFVRRSANARQPFFAFASFVDPHHAYNPPPPYGEMYSPADMAAPLGREGEIDALPPNLQRLSKSQARWRAGVARHRAQYLGEVSFIDDAVGRMLQALEDHGVRENTLVVYVSDHGDMLGDHGFFFKGPMHYRQAAAVPLIFHWPGRIREGKRIAGLMQEIDLFPTIAALAGLEETPGVQGRSQKHVLTGDSEDTGYDSILIEYQQNGATGPRFSLPPENYNPDSYTLRTDKWRMTYYPGQQYGELYHLENDPEEFVNRWKDPALGKVRTELRAQLLDRVLLARDPLPVRKDRY